MKWIEVGGLIIDFHYVIYVEKTAYGSFRKPAIEILLVNNMIQCAMFDTEQERDDIFENIRFNLTHEPDLF